MLYALLIALIAILYGIVCMKETFVLKYGNPFDDEDLVSTSPDAKGTRLFGITPDTCPCVKPELDAGLCYERCEKGYHGVGPVCWADTQQIDIGKVMLLKSCAQSGYAGYTDTGLLCSKWESNCVYWDWGLLGGYWTGCVKTGAKELSCDGYDGRYPDQIAALCYQKCPADKPNHVPGMPYLCFRGQRGLSYGRGVGDVPSIFKFGGCKTV